MSEKVRRGLVGDVSRVAKVFAVWQRTCRRRPVVDKRMVELRLSQVSRALEQVESATCGGDAISLKAISSS